MSTDDDRYEIVWLVRRLFRAFGQKADERLQDRGISAADRAILEFLYPDQGLSVPEIARKYQVSRQHVQVTINSLSEKGLVSSEENPRHKRSPLMRLTKQGRSLFASVLKNDKQVIDALFSDIPARDVTTTRETLRRLLETLNEESKP
jgi:DNA-binding MarR family transcriptional regulator